MSISTPPPPPPATPPKKRGLGCLGCGCLVLALLILLLAAFIGGIGYFVYSGAKSLSAEKPAEVTTIDATEDQYQAARQKISDFSHDVKNHQAATITLTADEINTLIARTPSVAGNHTQAYLTMSDSKARLRASIPTDMVMKGFMKGRYFNFDASFGVHFDAENKAVQLDLQTVTLNDKPVLGAGSDSGTGTGGSQSKRAMISAYINQYLNAGLRQNPDAAALLDQAKTVEIKNGQLVIETL